MCLHRNNKSLSIYPDQVHGKLIERKAGDIWMTKPGVQIGKVVDWTSGFILKYRVDKIEFCKIRQCNMAHCTVIAVSGDPGSRSNSRIGKVGSKFRTGHYYNDYFNNDKKLLS